MRCPGPRSTLWGSGVHREADAARPARPYDRAVALSLHSSRDLVHGRFGGFAVSDLALTTLFLVVSVASVLTGRPDEGPVVVTLPVAVVLSTSLAWRTRAPVVAGVVATAAGLVQAFAAETPGSLWAFALYLLLTYSVAAECEESWAAVGGVVLVGGQMVQERFDNGVDYVFIVLVFGGAWLLGRAIREWRGRATFAEEHQRDVALLAVAEERLRIARELHDVVAHALSVISVQADAAEAALARDPTLAGAPLRAIRSSARDALGDMRQLLGALRTEDDDAGVRRPARGLADLDQLVTAMRDAGLPLEARIEAVALLPPALDLAVYRITQEALTNVMKHAGAVATSLLIRADEHSVRVHVENIAGDQRNSPVGGGGHGLAGVGERVASVHGTFHAGPSANGGFVLSATLPLERPANQVAP
jgi:signal transduction histidine kinase